VVMTILLACAFDNAAAASVLSAALRRSPLPHRQRAVLSASWAAHLRSR